MGMWAIRARLYVQRSKYHVAIYFDGNILLGTFRFDKQSFIHASKIAKNAMPKLMVISDLDIIKCIVHVSKNKHSHILHTETVYNHNRVIIVLTKGHVLTNRHITIEIPGGKMLVTKLI